MLCLIWCVSPCFGADISISAAKLLPDSPTATVSLKTKVVTYASADYFYIEEDNRNMGIRVEKTTHGLQVGMSVNITGTMKTNANKERAILATTAMQSGIGAITPVGMNSKALGGGDWNVVGNSGQIGVAEAVGLNNIGLLIKTWGRYQPIDLTSFEIDDGSGLNIKCTVPAGTFLYSWWQYVVVTGISSIYKPNSTTYLPNILVRNFEVVTTHNVPLEMISIPAGSFLMGNNGNEPYSYSNELPQHSITLSAYSIGKYEVTRNQYRQFMTAGGYDNSSYWSAAGWSWKVSNSRTEPYWWAASQSWGIPPGVFTQTDNNPVVGVSYYEAEAFCNWAGGYLPTEAQWERAARWTGTHANVYPWGDIWNQEYCNNYSDTVFPRYQTSPVGSYLNYPSPSGCQDMAGNVGEWCKDWYMSNYYATGPSIDPQGPESGSYHIVRGGDWVTTAAYSRCAYRYNEAPGSYGTNRGFRLAR